MKAEIIASGTELLLGEIADTNTSYIAGQLAALGIDVYYTSIVGDNYERYLGVLKQAWQRSDLIITTGGLGPTKGDLTREVIAGLLGEMLAIDPVVKQEITDHFLRIGMEMPLSNIKQAALIPSARAIPNPLGTAPGWWVEKSGHIIAALPGPPGEMKPMWQKEVYPRLEISSDGVILSRVLKIWGLSEAKIDELLAPFVSASNPTSALYAKADGIHVRITAKSADRQTAAGLIAGREAEIRKVLADNIWGMDDDFLEDVVGRLLIKKGLTLAVGESCTNGALSNILASAVENQRYFKGSLIATTGESKVLAGFNPALIGDIASVETATGMAVLARAKFASDIGIGTDGYLEMNGDIPASKVFVAIVGGSSDQPMVQSFSWRPNMATARAARHALFNLRKLLISMGGCT